MGGEDTLDAGEREPLSSRSVGFQDQKFVCCRGLRQSNGCAQLRCGGKESRIRMKMAEGMIDHPPKFPDV